MKTEIGQLPPLSNQVKLIMSAISKLNHYWFWLSHSQVKSYQDGFMKTEINQLSPLSNQVEFIS